MAAYLIRTALCLTFFYIAYRVLLHEKCRYPVNRIYLVGSFLLSFIIPLITIDISLIRMPSIPLDGNSLQGTVDVLQARDIMINMDQPAQGINPAISLSRIVLLLYLAGIIVFMIRYGLDLSRLIRMIAKSKKLKFRHYTLVKLDHPVAPFSFFRYIFVYDQDAGSEDFQRFIITHERAHIRSWHSLDSVFLGLGQIIQWFNPVVLLYKKAVVALHEFSADRAVMESTESLTGYQQKILKYACIRNEIMFTSNLSNTMLKKRFIMMTKQNQGRHTTIRVIASAIAAAFLLLAFSNGDKIGVKSLPDRMNLVSSMPGSEDNASPVLIPVKDTSRNSVADQPESSSLQDIEVEKEIQILGEELDRMKQKECKDSLSHLPHAQFFVDPREFSQQMAEIQAELAERQLRHAERQLRLADEQRMLAERLKPLREGPPAIIDAERLRRMAEDQARIKHYLPMIEEHFRLEHLRPFIGEPLLFLPPVPPFHLDDACPDKEEYQLQMEKQLKNLENKHWQEQESLRSLEEKDPKIIKEQMEWQEKYRREMEKQRDQMEKTRRQLMDEYHQMMNKYRKENENK